MRGILAVVLGALALLGTVAAVGSVKSVTGVFNGRFVVDGDVYPVSGHVYNVTLPTGKVLRGVDGAALVSGYIVGIYHNVTGTPVHMAVVNGPSVVAGHVVIEVGQYARVGDYVYVYPGSRAVVIEGYIYRP